jgi:hypothetical protein
MEYQERQEIVNRLLLNVYFCHINGTTYIVQNPTYKTILLAERIYHQEVSKNRFSGWMTDRMNKAFLIKKGKITPQIDENLKELNKRLEDLKLDLYRSAFRVEFQKQFRKSIQQIKDKIVQLTVLRHSFDHITVKGFAGVARGQFLVGLSTLNSFGEQLWECMDDVDFELLNKLISSINDQRLTESEAREIARTNPWRGYWDTHHESAFDSSSMELNDDQKTVILFSRMYDNAYKHQDCPTDDIIKDDDMFDGWIVEQRRKSDKAKVEGQVQDVLGGRHKKAQEIFIPAGSKADADKINMLNSPQSQIVKKQREVFLDKMEGRAVPDGKLPDKQMEMRRQVTQKFKDTVKGNKNG